MTSLNEPKVKGTIICDDIREEASGKLTYVGVYPENRIEVNDIPTLMSQLVMQLSIDVSHAVPKSIGFIVKNPDRKVMFAQDVRVPKPPKPIPNTLNIRIHLVPFNLTKTGRYIVLIKFEGKAKRAGTFDVVKKISQNPSE